MVLEFNYKLYKNNKHVSIFEIIRYKIKFTWIYVAISHYQLEWTLTSCQR